MLALSNQIKCVSHVITRQNSITEAIQLPSLIRLWPGVAGMEPSSYLAFSSLGVHHVSSVIIGRVLINFSIALNWL